MKVPAALVSLALASVAVAQGSPELPGCATECAAGFLTGGIGDCGQDIKCICENKDFLGDISCCLADVCSEDEQQQAIDYAIGICGGADAQGLPTEVSCSTSAPTPTADNAENPESTNLGPRPTAAAGLGAIGGIIAAVALL